MEENTDDRFLGEYQTILLSSGIYKTELSKKFENRKKWVANDPKKIYTVIPGTIIDVLVKPGQAVMKGEIILILESMKMQNQILMPFDGKIKTIFVKADDKIPREYLMIELA
jgi:biotin carboxyl carrier protein